MDLTTGDTQLIIKTCKSEGVSVTQAAYLLATTYHETNFTMKPVREAYWLSEGWRQRNLRYYPFYGRGHVQLTWDYNYVKASKAFNIDLLKYPDKVMDTEISVKVLVRGCMEGWFTGKALPTYVNDTKKNYVGARRVVNGVDKASAIAGYAVEYENLLITSGYDKTPVKSATTFWETLKQLFERLGF